MADQNSPLNDTHLSQIQNALSVLDRAQQQVDLAKRAGINVDAEQQQITDTRSKLLSVKNVYFPSA